MKNVNKELFCDKYHSFMMLFVHLSFKLKLILILKEQKDENIKLFRTFWFYSQTSNSKEFCLSFKEITHSLRGI